MKKKMTTLKSILAIALLIWACPNIYAQKIDSIKLKSAVVSADSLIENNPNVFFKNVESLIAWHNGDVVFEHYYHGYNGDSLHQIQSQTKSLVALLMGIAIEKGFIKNENRPVADYFPEYFNSNDTLKFQVTIRDLLTMSAGFEWEEMIPFNDPKNDNANMYRSGNWLNYALTRPMS